MFYTTRWDNDPNIVLLCTADGIPFPPNEANEIYQQYLAWLAEGNTPEPWEAPDAN